MKITGAPNFEQYQKGERLSDCRILFPFCISPWASLLRQVMNSIDRHIKIGRRKSLLNFNLDDVMMVKRDNFNRQKG